MKYIISAIIVCVAVAICAIFGFQTNTESNSEYLRIHIRANSNLEIDQDIKYKVKDAVVDSLIPLVSECTTKAKAEEVMSANFNLIESVANKVLAENGFNYTAKAKLACEEFPTRSYETLTLEEGFYDALIINLGSGQGNNWWCVVYPPLCFLQTNATGKNVAYKSKIWDIIKSVIG